MSFHFTHDATQLNQSQSNALVLQKFICIDSNARNPTFLYLYKYNLAALFCEDNNKPVFIIYHGSSYELWHHWLLCSPVKHLVLFQLHDHVDFKCNIIVYTSQGLYYTARWKQFYRQCITCEKAIVTIHIFYVTQTCPGTKSLFPFLRRLHIIKPGRHGLVSTWQSHVKWTKSTTMTKSLILQFIFG